MRQRLGGVAVVLAALSVGVAVPAATGHSHDQSGGAADNSDVVVSNDDRVGKKPSHERPSPREFADDYAEVVSADSELGRRLNPHKDPHTRVCDARDGTVWVLHVYPAPGKPAFSDDPADKRLRPC